MDKPPPDSPDLSGALLRWISMYDFARTVKKYKDLQDGRVLWQLGHQIHPGHFAGELPHPDADTTENWIPRWENFKHIDKYLMSFLRDVVNQYHEVSRRINIDLKAIAIDASTEDLLQLLKLMFVAALLDKESNQHNVALLQQLSDKQQLAMAEIFKGLDAWESSLAEAASQGLGSDIGMLSPTRSGASPEPGFQRDPELEWEERLIEANAVIREKETNIANLHSLVDEYRKHNGQLEEEVNELKYQQEQGGGASANSEALDQMRKKTMEDREYIAELEAERHTLRDSQEEVENQLRRYKNDADSKQKLRDDLQMVKVERDDLLQKTKASDNLRKKIQSLQDADKTNASLRQENEALQEELKSGKGSGDKVRVLQRQIEENMKTIANGEQEIFDMKTTRRRLDSDLKYFHQRYEAAKERCQRDADTIAEQEQRIRDLEAGQGRLAPAADTLDDEVESSDKAHAELRAKLAEIEKENAQLKKGADVPPVIASDDPALKQQIETLQQRCHRIEADYLSTYQENIGLDAAVNELDENVLESRPFLETRDRLQEAKSKLDDSEKQLSETQRELVETKSALAQAEGRFAAMEEDKVKSAEAIRKSAAGQSEVLQKENERLMSRVESLQIQLDDKTSLLRHALTDQGRLLKEDEELRNSNETRLIQEQVTQHKTKDEPNETELVLSLAQRIEHGRKRLREAEDKANQTEQTLTSQLETQQLRLKRAEEIARRRNVTDDAGNGKISENVQRELALMTSAWYDLSSRLQSDAVIVQRRAEAPPKSWLGRQRRRVLG